MVLADPFTARGDPGGGKAGCAFINGHVAPCGAVLRLGSSYCPRHHALTHIPRGSPAENAELKAINALAKIVGGRLGKGGVIGPLPGDIEELERRAMFAVIGPGHRRHVPK